MTTPTVLKILTRKEQKAHYPTELTIDWTGITEADLIILARNALIHEFQGHWSKAPGAIPEKFTMVAKTYVDNTPAIKFKYQDRPKKSNIDKLFESLKESLTNEQIKELLESV
jgi:hypothetical protein